MAAASERSTPVTEKLPDDKFVRQDKTPPDSRLDVKGAAYLAVNAPSPAITTFHTDSQAPVSNAYDAIETETQKKTFKKEKSSRHKAEQAGAGHPSASAQGDAKKPENAQFELSEKLHCSEISSDYLCPATNRNEYIGLHLFITDNVSKSNLSKNKVTELELFGLRRAADAGCAFAQIQLIKRLLYSDDRVYLPFEAEYWLLKLSESDNAILLDSKSEKESEKNAAIRSITNLIIKNKTDPVNAEKFRAQVCKTLSLSTEIAIQACGPMLYLSGIFGRVSPAAAQTYIEENNPPAHKHSNQDANKKWQYWQINVSIKQRDEKKCKLVLNSLCDNGFLAAIHLQSELYRWTVNTRQCYDLLFKVTTKYSDLIRLSPHSCYSLYQCFIKTRRKAASSSEKPLISKLNERINALENKAEALKVIALNNGYEPAVFATLAKLYLTHCSPEKCLDTGIKGPITLPAEFTELLDKNRFTNNATIAVLTHASQCLSHKETDNFLLDRFIDEQPLKTALIMLFTGYYTYFNNNVKLTELVVRHSELDEHEFRMFVELEESSRIIEKFERQKTFIYDPDPLKVFKLLTLLRVQREIHLCRERKLIYRGIHVHDLKNYIRHLHLTQSPELTAVLISEAATRLNLEFSQGRCFLFTTAEELNQTRYYIRRRNLPAEYIKLENVETDCYLPEMASLSYAQLTGLFQSAAQIKDVEFNTKLLRTCKSFVQNSWCHLSEERLLQLLTSYSYNCKKTQDLADVICLKASEKIIRLTRIIAQNTSTETTNELHPDNERKACSESGPEETIPAHLRFVLNDSHELFFVEDMYEQLIAEEKSSQKKVRLINEVINRKRYCPVSLLRYIDTSDVRQCLAVNQLAIISSIIHKLTIKVYGTRDAIIKGLCSSDKIIMALMLDVLNTYSLSNMAFHRTVENLLCDTLKSRPEILLDVPCQKLEILGESKLQEYFKYSYMKNSVKLLMLLQEKFSPRQILSWLEDNNKKLTRMDYEEFYELTNNANEKDKYFKELIYFFLTDTETAQYCIKEPNTSSVDELARMIWFGYEAKIIDIKTAEKCLAHIPENNGYYLLTSILLGLTLTTGKAELTDLISGLDKENKLIFLPALGLKLFSLNRLDLAEICWSGSSQAFHLSLMKLNHGIMSGSESENTIAEVFFSAAAEGNVQAQCRILDWHLMSRKLDSLTLKRCCRYILTPQFNHTMERELYQGLLRAGYCDKDVSKTGDNRETNDIFRDETQARRHLHNALNHQSPIPVFRLLILNIKGIIDVTAIANIMSLTSLNDLSLLKFFIGKYKQATQDEIAEIILSASPNDLKVINRKLDKYLSRHDCMLIPEFRERLTTEVTRRDETLNQKQSSPRGALTILADIAPPVFKNDAPEISRNPDSSDAKHSAPESQTRSRSVKSSSDELINTRQNRIKKNDNARTDTKSASHVTANRQQPAGERSPDGRRNELCRLKASLISVLKQPSVNLGDLLIVIEQIKTLNSNLSCIPPQLICVLIKVIPVETNTSLLSELFSLVTPDSEKVTLIEHLFSHTNKNDKRHFYLYRSFLVQVLPDSFKPQTRHLNIIVNILKSYQARSQALPQKITLITLKLRKKNLADVLWRLGGKTELFEHLYAQCLNRLSRSAAPLTDNESEVVVRYFEADSTPFNDKVTCLRLMLRHFPERSRAIFNTCSNKHELFGKLTTDAKLILLSDETFKQDFIRHMPLTGNTLAKIENRYRNFVIKKTEVLTQAKELLSKPENELTQTRLFHCYLDLEATRHHELKSKIALKLTELAKSWLAKPVNSANDLNELFIAADVIHQLGLPDAGQLQTSSLVQSVRHNLTDTDEQGLLRCPEQCIELLRQYKQLNGGLDGLPGDIVRDLKRFFMAFELAGLDSPDLIPGFLHRTLMTLMSDKKIRSDAFKRQRSNLMERLSDPSQLTQARAPVIVTILSSYQSQKLAPPKEFEDVLLKAGLNILVEVLNQLSDDIAPFERLYVSCCERAAGSLNLVSTKLIADKLYNACFDEAVSFSTRVSLLKALEKIAPSRAYSALEKLPFDEQVSVAARLV